MRILVLRGGALGDFLVTIPALQLLRTRWPAARIELAGNARAAELAIVSGLIDAAHSQHEARWSALFNEAPLAPDLMSWLDCFDLIVSYWPDVDGTLRGHFRHRNGGFIGASARATTRPAAKHFCDALAPLGLATNDYRSRIALPTSACEESAKRLEGFNEFVAVHPGSGSPSKNWPVERWIDVCARLKTPVLVVTGEVERTAAPWPTDLNVRRADQWPLIDLAAALMRTRQYLGHDSGVSHLAAAVGAKCLLLFGPTEPEIWAPPGENVTVLKRGSRLEEISAEDVLKSLAGT